MNRLVLFDIDGTLLTAGGAAARAFRRGLERVFGTAGPVEGHSFAGKTDPQIARELLRAAGLSDDEIDAGIEALWAAYLLELPGELEHARVRVMPGVHALLERLESNGSTAVLGLLTGNIEPGAALKLGAAGLDVRRFRIGAYGSDHADRPELPAVAVGRAERRLGRRFAGKEVVIIGDTPHDVSCGAGLGVRTIAVATGGYGRHQLEACGPDHLFDDLADLERVCEAIFSD